MRASIVVALALAFIGGWWSRGYFDKADDTHVRTYTRETVQAAPQVIVVEKTLPQRLQSVPVAEPQRQASSATNPFERFRDLLQQLQFSQAMQWYADHEPELSDKALQQWQSYLTNFLAGKLNSGETQSFIELSGLWLEQHYSDIEVLLLVAQYHRGKGHFTEAMQSYLQAHTYAYTEQQRKRVHDELQNFIYQRDTEYAEQGQWQALKLFYEQLVDLDIASDSQRFRYAELVLMLGDDKTAFALLDQLQLSTPGWRPKIQQLRAQYQRDGRYHAGRTQSHSFQSVVAMQPAGSHYLITIGINDNSSHTLLLDTGASITMLTEASFYRASQGGGWKEMGTSLFNTANGLVRGRMMQVDKLQIGEYLLRDVRVAVQQTEFGDGVEGLLGMNVLRQFHFQIDQDNHQLLLNPR